MSAPNIDFGKLTAEETAELAAEALEELTLDERVKVVLKTFSVTERDVLRSALHDEAVDDL